MKLFISYRRDDTQLTARAMKTLLDDIPAISDVFLDFDEIAIGSDFEKEINAAIAKSNACLILIGKSYRGPGEDGAPARIMNPGDFVRKEAALALASKKKVIPVLVDGTEMPSASDLPEELRTLPKLNAFQLRTSHFEDDMYALLDVLFGKTKARGQRWRRPPLTLRGSLARLSSGALLAGVLVVTGAIVSSLLGQMTETCGSLTCRAEQAFGFDYDQARNFVIGTLALILALGALIPFLPRLVRR